MTEATMAEYKFTLKTVSINLAKEAGSKIIISQPSDAVMVLRALFQRLDADREHFVILALDAKNGLVGHKVVSTGGAAGTAVDPKTLFRDALLLGGVSIICAHNHPSGDSTPSQEDLRLTRKLVDGGRLLDMKIHDHIILGEGLSFTSFAERGLLS
jgi:DNA repair protein RadC